MIKTYLCNQYSNALVIIISLFLSSALVSGQTNQTPNTATAAAVSTDKAEQVLKRAIEALGGDKYLGIRSVIGTGFYTQYQDGVSTVPSKFIDYLIYPDKERTEFVGQGVKVIQTNVGKSGWIFDGLSRNIKDVKAEQAEEFQVSIRTSVENLLRGWWRQENAQLSYIGRREAGLAKRNETVAIKYPDDFTIEFEFGAKDGLPAKILYKRKNSQEQAEETQEEIRFGQYVTMDGVVTPLVIDHFSNGKQVNRINYETLKFNSPISEKLFERPTNIKDLK